jgi:mono/diheme cytochrome c family protein
MGQQLVEGQINSNAGSTHLGHLDVALSLKPYGSVEAGRGLFASRGCSRCHGAKAQGTSLGPALGGRGKYFNSVALAAAFWRHGPEMYRRTQTLGIPWPKLQENDLGDLFAFLNATPEERQN